MKKSLLSASVALFAVAITWAGEVPISNGYYRVKNYKTNRFVYVYDNTGSINAAAGSADAGALELWKDPVKPLTDPASVLYANYIGDNGKGGYSYDVEGQGTGVHEIIGYFVSILREDGHLKIYASLGGVTKYLDDEESNPNRDKGAMGFNREGDYRKWDEIAIDANSDNYFGVAPTIQANGKYYQPFYAEFPFNFASSGMRALYVKEFDAAENIAVIAEVQGDVPGAMPVIVECSSAESTNNRFNLLRNDDVPYEQNQLAGVYFRNERRKNLTANDPATMRVLSTNAAGELVFAVSAEEYMPANQSYLVVPDGTPAEVKIMTEEEYNSRTIAVSAISLNATEATMTEGETLQLSATVAPDNATNAALSWSSNDDAVATVDAAGLVTALAPGTAIITAKSTDGSNVEASCTISVEAKVYLVTDITLNATEIIFEVGNTAQLIATVTPDNATNATLEWVSSDETVVTVDATGLVTAVAPGVATVIAKATDGSNVEASCAFTVNQMVNPDYSEITLNFTESTMNVGETLLLEATLVLPIDVTDTSISWTSSESSVASVDETGLVTALTPGETVITATSNAQSELTASCVITVLDGEGIRSVSLDSKAAADVFTLTGVKVRNVGEALQGLTAGLYIVDGKKVIVY